MVINPNSDVDYTIQVNNIGNSGIKTQLKICQSYFMQTAVRMGWITLRWISPWRTVLGSLWMVLRGHMMGSSSAATAIMLPEGQLDSLNTSEFTQVKFKCSFVKNNEFKAWKLTCFVILFFFKLCFPQNRRETSPLPPVPICFSI